MVDRSLKFALTTLAASVAVENLRRPDPARRRADLHRQPDRVGETARVARRLSGAASDLVLRGVWNTAYALWEITIFGRRLQSRS